MTDDASPDGRDPDGSQSAADDAGPGDAERHLIDVDVVDDRGLPVIRAGNDDYNVSARGLFSTKDAEGYLPSPDSDLLRVSTESFEGPLDLLLFLIEKHAVDILDIPIKVIVVEYLKVLDDMR